MGWLMIRTHQLAMPDYRKPSEYRVFFHEENADL